jgi:hypothetical protein
LCRSRKVPACFRYVYLLEPPPKLSRHGRKPWVVRCSEPGHVHVVAVDSDRDIPGEDGRVLRYYLSYRSAITRVTIDLSRTYLADSWQGQLLIEAADVNQP